MAAERSVSLLIFFHQWMKLLLSRQLAAAPPPLPDNTDPLMQAHLKGRTE